MGFAFLGYMLDTYGRRGVGENVHSDKERTVGT